MLSAIVVVGACQEHIPAYALVSDDAGVDAAADADDAGDAGASDLDVALEARATGD
jgi:hypothetical protein